MTRACSLWGSRWAIRVAIALTAILLSLPGPAASAAEMPVLTFLQIQPDVRARGMGEAAVGLTESAGPYASNPATLALADNTHLYAGGGEWLPEYNLDLAYYCAGASGHIADFGTVAVSLRLFSYGEIIRSTGLGFVDQYHSVDLALGGSVAVPLDRNVAIGTTISLIRSKLADPNPEQDFGSGGATSVAFDVGVLIHDIIPQATAVSRAKTDTEHDPDASRVQPFRSPHAHGFSVGIALQNLGPDIDYGAPQMSGPIPRIMAMGISYCPVDIDKLGAVLSAQVDGSLVDDGRDFTDRLVLRMGAEVSLFSAVDTRVGHFEDPVSNKGATTLGFGLRYERVRFNLSYIPKLDMPLSKTFFLSLDARV